MTGARHASVFALVTLLAASGACRPVEQGETSLAPTPDVTAYTAEVHPYVERRCATLDCHGDPGRPLRIYSETALRAVGRDRILPLDAEELALNVQSIAAVDPFADPDHHLVVAKPLAPGAGGMAHVGGDDIWRDRTDPGYACLRDWLAGNATADACTVALDALPVP